MTVEAQLAGSSVRITVPSNTNETVLVVNGTPVTVAAYPTGIATAKVEYTISPHQLVEDGNGKWFDWPPGTVSAATIETFVNPIRALRLTATDANVDFEIAA